jgi:hypothetical protein
MSYEEEEDTYEEEEDTCTLVYLLSLLYQRTDPWNNFPKVLFSKVGSLVHLKPQYTDFCQLVAAI